MSFSNFIDIIISSFQQVFNLITNIIGALFQNNFVKLTIFIILIFLGIGFIDKIINLILNIFSQKKNISNEKTTNTNTDIE